MEVKSKKAFTLIELLAVIVILAIIALIATPIIINIISEARENSYKRSAELYLSAAQVAIVKENLISETNPEVCNVIEEGNLSCNNKEIKVDITKNIPTSGEITFRNGKIVGVSNLIIGNYTYNMDENGNLVFNNGDKPCIRLTDNDGYDKVICDTEVFYVTSENSTDVVLFSSKNITVTENNPKQNSSAGSLTFSESPYWGDVSNKTYIYNNPSNLYKYLEAYKKTLTDMGINVKSVKIPSYNDINNLPREYGDIRENIYIQYYFNNIPEENVTQMISQIQSITNEEYIALLNENGIINYYPPFLSYTIEEQAKMLILYSSLNSESLSVLDTLLKTFPTWANNSPYWLGSADNSESIYSLNFIDIPSGQLSGVPYNDTSWSLGIRPIVIISLDSIE